VAEALQHTNGETRPVRIKGDCAVDPIAAARVEFDAETADHHAVAQCLVEWIAGEWPRSDVQELWCWRVEGARRSDQRRGPGAALLIHRRDEEERELGKELAVLLRQVLANEAMANFFNAVA